jgi:hypothetical protein
MSYTDVEYFLSEHDHAIAVAKSVVHAWDLRKPEALLESLRYLHEVVEQVAARAEA